jgi:hypothetical protein
MFHLPGKVKRVSHKDRNCMAGELAAAPWNLPRQFSTLSCSTVWTYARLTDPARTVRNNFFGIFYLSGSTVKGSGEMSSVGFGNKRPRQHVPAAVRPKKQRFSPHLCDDRSDRLPVLADRQGREKNAGISGQLCPLVDISLRVSGG